MKTMIRKWGNSLAIRIPQGFALHLGMESGSEVELSLEPDGIHIASAPFSLHSLLQGITPENIHAETFRGSVQGKEIW